MMSKLPGENLKKNILKVSPFAELDFETLSSRLYYSLEVKIKTKIELSPPYRFGL